MNILSGKYPKETPWEEFSDKLVRYYKLPYGSRFALKRGGAAKTRRARGRSDIRIHRQLLLKEQHPRHDNLTTSDVCNRIEVMLAPHHGHKFSVIGIGPDGVRIDGHTTLKTWRNKAPKPTARQTHYALQRREEIATLVEKGLILITDLEEGLGESEQKIPQAMIHITSLYMECINGLHEVRVAGEGLEGIGLITRPVGLIGCFWS